MVSRAFFASAVTAALLLASPLIAAPIPVGDASFAARSDDGRSIDVDKTVNRLADMHIDFYLYDIPHGTDAWDKLPAFCDAAAKQNIDVWVYLFPWSLAKRGGKNLANEPFGTDYVRWCDAVGKLMHDHPNLKGIVMDDFASNIEEVETEESEKFSEQLVGQMIDAGRRANPQFGFQPILYFDGPWEQTLGHYAKFFGDGAIVCYPRSTREVDHAIEYLQDEPRGASLGVELPRKRKLKPGEETVAIGRLDKGSASNARSISFFVDEHGSNTGVRGVHHIVLRVDGREIWRRELDGEAFNKDFNVPLPRVAAHSKIEAAVVCDRSAENETVRIRLDDVRLNDGDGKMLRDQPAWADELNDGIAFFVAQPTTQGKGGRWSIPLTILVAGAPFEHEKIFNEKGDAAHIAAKVNQALGWARQAKAKAVMTWGTPKDQKDDPVRSAVAEAFGKAK